MKDLEANKIAAAVLFAGLIAMVCGKIADILYHPELEPKTRGFAVEVLDNTAVATAPEEEINLAELLAAANVQAGQKLSKKCTACHDFEKGGKHKVGPALWNIINAAKASQADYAYTAALKEAGGNWDEESLFEFLRNPKKYAPGTKMSFIGLKKAQEAADMVAYIKSKKD